MHVEEASVRYGEGGICYIIEVLSEFQIEKLPNEEIPNFETYDGKDLRERLAYFKTK